MASFQSSFHPIFWLHHNNVDRIYEKYISLETDSHDEMERQHKLSLRRNREFNVRGLPGGTSYSNYAPFTHPYRDTPFHAKDCFDTKGIGYVFDKLPAIKPPQMRAPPVYAVFKGIDVNELPHSASVFVYVGDKSTPGTWAPPAPDREGKTTLTVLRSHPNLAGIGAIFFLDLDGGCENCKQAGNYTMHVDITDAVKERGIKTSNIEVRCMVRFNDGAVKERKDTPVPAPQVCGPRFQTALTENGDNDTDDVKELQRLLQKYVDPTLNVTGVIEYKTTAAIKKFQTSAGLKADGVAGPETQKRLLVESLHEDSKFVKKLEASPGDTVTWSIDQLDVPAYLNFDQISKEITEAFAKWAPDCGLVFKQGEVGEAQVTIGFGDESEGDNNLDNPFQFDGPGGCLAVATDNSITFDESERWVLQTDDRAAIEADRFTAEEHFQFQPVLIHEIGHLLGLEHSEHFEDVMSPYYIKDQVDVSSNDREICGAIWNTEAGAVSGLAKLSDAGTVSGLAKLSDA